MFVFSPVIITRGILRYFKNNTPTLSLVLNFLNYVAKRDHQSINELLEIRKEVYNHNGTQNRTLETVM